MSHKSIFSIIKVLLYECIKFLLIAFFLGATYHKKNSQVINIKREETIVIQFIILYSFNFSVFLKLSGFQFISLSFKYNFLNFDIYNTTPYTY